MIDSPLPDSLRRFLSNRIDSVEQLETLALMDRSHRWWTAREVAQELHLSSSATAHDLEVLAGRGLFEVRLGSDLSYRVSVISPEHAQAIRALMDLYPVRRVEILGYLVARKGRALRHFAEAFRFRKDR